MIARKKRISKKRQQIELDLVAMNLSPSFLPKYVVSPVVFINFTELIFSNNIETDAVGETYYYLWKLVRIVLYTYLYLYI